MNRRSPRPRASARVLEQYLQRHAEPEAREAPPVSRAFARAAVVPALGEGDSLLRAIDSIRAAGQGEALVIVVLNARASDPPAVHAANQAARERLRGDDLLVVDRARPGRWLPEKQGVGLARKIGTDVAVALRAAGRLAGRWIHHTDADAEVPADWFARAEAAPDDAVALTVPFRHEPATRGAAAGHVDLYELWLRYHRLGLAAAGSPYAFQAIGSTMITDADAVVLVRGWPRTMAGEDFYLLDKLAKLGPVRSVPGAPVRLAGRPSDRVPFGTGRALIDMAARRETPATFTMLPPDAYAALGVVLAALDAAADAGRAVDIVDAVRHAPGAPRAGALVPALLDDMGVAAFVARARALNLSTAVRRRRLHTWFDAFRTLRFLHGLRDRGMAPIPWREALAAAGFAGRPRPGSAPAGRPSPGGAPDDRAAVSPAEALRRLQEVDETTALVAGVSVVAEVPGAAGAPALSRGAKSSAMTDCR